MVWVKLNFKLRLGLNTKDEAEDLFNQYHQNSVPFVRDLIVQLQKQLRHQVIGTLLGRRCRFDKWEPAQYWINKPME